MSKNILVILFVLLISTSCNSLHDKYNYPLKEVSLSNYENVDFKYRVVKNFEYKFCNGCLYTSCSGDDKFNLVERAIAEFKKENTLGKNQYLTNFDVETFAHIEKFFIVAGSTCRTVKMDLVEKIDE